MKKIEAIIKPFKLDEVKQKLTSADIVAIKLKLQAGQANSKKYLIPELSDLFDIQGLAGGDKQFVRFCHNRKDRLLADLVCSVLFFLKLLMVRKSGLCQAAR